MAGWDQVALAEGDSDRVEAIKIAILDARAAKDFATSDRLRDGLVAAGFEVKISKTGVEVDPSPSADFAALPEV